MMCRESNGLGAAELRTVLIIDDAAEVLALAQIFLKATGQWRVFTAMSGEAGLEVAFREKPDVMLIDVRMPGIGGIATLEQIRAQQEWQPICAFLTASPEDLDPAMLDRLQVPVIAKPFRAATFPGLIAALAGVGATT